MQRAMPEMRYSPAEADAAEHHYNRVLDKFGEYRACYRKWQEDEQRAITPYEQLMREALYGAVRITERIMDKAWRNA